MCLHPLLSVDLSTLDVFQVVMDGGVHGIYVTFGSARRSSDPVPWVYPSVSNQSHLFTHQLVDHLLLLADANGISRSIHRSDSFRNPPYRPESPFCSILDSSFQVGKTDKIT